MADTTFRGLIYGQAAHADPLACVADLPVQVASRRVAGYPHSIWQIVLHMNYWMDYDLRTMAGEILQYPEHAIESWPDHAEARGSASESEWRNAVAQFGGLLEQLAALADSGKENLGRITTKVTAGNTRRECAVQNVLVEIIAHNSYHTGQIALLRRQAGAWPPERGGDTW
jgi:uncharacterized damage-inducible protein DinB